MLTLKDIRPIILAIKEFYDNSTAGETVVLLDEPKLEEINGIYEIIYMTNIAGKAVLVHYDTEGDWTKSVLIPESNFSEEESYPHYEYSPADEAIEWFFK